MPWPLLVALSFGAFWTVTLELLPAGLLPEMTADLGVPPSRIGLLVTAWAVTVGLASLPLTRFTRTWSRPTALAAGLSVLGTATLASALLPTYSGVLAARLVAALGHGLFWSVLMVYAASLAPRGREGRAISVVLAGPILAGVAGLPVATAASSLVGWRWVVGAVAGGLLIGAAVLRAVLMAAPDAHPPAPTGAGADPTARRVRRTAVLGAVTLAAHFAVFTFIAELVERRWALEGLGVDVVLLLFGVAGAVGLAVVALVGDRSPRGLLLATVAAIATTFVVLGLVEGAVVVTATVAVWGLLIGALPPALQNAVIGAASPTYRETAGAVLVTVFNLGIAAGAAAGGLVIDHVGLDWLLPVAAVATTTSTAGLWRVTRA